MRVSYLISWLIAAATLQATAQIIDSQTFSSGFPNGGVVPDGNLSGWSDTRAISEPSSLTISDLRVTLNISGGYNGDLYAYLTHGSSFAVLLNRVGVGQTQGDAFGYADAGMTVTFATSGNHANIHWYGGGGIPTGTFLPDGRAVDPLSTPAQLEGASTGANFTSALGIDPNGNWTLFVADVSAGGGLSTVTSWGLQITAVPEPTQASLFVGILLLIIGLGYPRSTRRATPAAR